MSETPPPIRVLHVDDESEFLDLTATYLKRQDDRLTIETTTSADAGLDSLAADEFDCVISDYDMPGMTGIDFLHAVREDYPDLPFILFTGKGSEEVASDAISAGVTDYLQKQRGPEQYELLANRITNAVEQRRARTQAQEHNRVSSVVREINRVLVQATSREEVDRRVCQILTDGDPYIFAWIGTVDPATDRITPQAAAGIGEESYLDDITVTVDDSPTGRGPGGTALQENRVVVSQNIDQDDAFEPWREDAREQGYRAVAGIPLTHEDTQYGLLAVYADRAGAFDASERTLLGELGDTIAHAYHRLDIQQEYEDQYRELFEEAPVMFSFTREVDGKPIIEDCNQLFADTLGYAREELRGRPLATVYTEGSAQRLLRGGYDRALTGEFVREQREFVTRKGDVVTTLLRATPRRNAEGEVIGTHALFVDITDQTRLQTLEELHSRIEFALDATDSTLFELDFESGQETRHGPFKRLYGIEPEAVETTEAFYQQCVHPEDRDMLRELQSDKELADRDGSVACDFRRHPDHGPERWIHFEGYAVTDQNGNQQRLIGLNTDITERKQRESQLRQEQHRFETLFTQFTQPLVEVEYEGLDPIVTDVNPAFEETFGYDAATIVGDSLDAYIVPEDQQDEADEINRHVREAGRLVSREVTRQTADGPREFLLENAVYEDGSGGFAIYTDVTEHKQRERDLERMREFFRKAERLGDLGVWELDESGNVFWTEGAKRIHEIDDDYELTVESAFELIHPDDRDHVRQIFEAALESGDPYDVELRIVTAEGNERWVHNHGRPVESDGTSQAFIGLLQDITERKERERELQRQNERLDQFASVVSHDLRNPLRIASTRLALVAEECESPHLGDVADAHDRMDQLIEGLLTFARVGSEAIDRTAVDLAGLLDECWDTLPSEDATLVVETEQEIRADPDRLQQLLTNLLSNALDHCGSDVTVRIGDLSDGFYVEDDGPGIPDDTRTEIFTAGYSSAQQGPGLGLSIVKQVVDAHGWDIDVTDGADGGARFEITGVEFTEC